MFGCFHFFQRHHSKCRMNRKEDEGGVSLIGIGGIGDGKKGNAYVRILFFKIRLPWW